MANFKFIANWMSSLYCKSLWSYSYWTKDFNVLNLWFVIDGFVLIYWDFFFEKKIHTMWGHLIYYYSLDGVAKRVFKLLMLSNTTVFVKKLKSKIKAIAFLLMALKTPFLRYKSTIGHEIWFFFQKKNTFLEN